MSVTESNLKVTKKSSVSLVKRILSVKHHFDKFCTEIEIPGVREAYTTNHFIVRILWITFLTMGSALTIYFIYQDISDYSENPTATKVYPSRNASYDLPPVYFGSIQMEHREKGWKAMGLSDPAISYIKSLDWHAEKAINESLYEESFNEFLQYINENNITLWGELFQKTALDAKKDFQLECDDCFADTEFGQKKFVSFLPNLISVLYEVPFKPATPSWVRTSGADVGMSFSIMKANTEQYYLVLGKSYNLIIPDDFFPIWPNFDYDIRVSASRIKGLNNGKCKESTVSDTGIISYHPKLCADACSDAYLYQCAKCKKVRPDNLIDIPSNNSAPNKRKPYCSTLKHNISCIHQKSTEARITKCTLACLPLCDQTIYEYSVVNVPSFDNRIKITFYPTYTDAGILTFEEVPTYTFESAVSNIGGQLGLWLGLSIVTFVQISLFWLNQCLTKERRHSIAVLELPNDKSTVQTKV